MTAPRRSSRLTAPKDETPKKQSQAQADDSDDTKDIPLFFWSTDRRGGTFSNMYKSEFEHCGTRYNSSEMFFQAAKSAFFGDENTKKKILVTADPKGQKALGKKVKNFEEEAWNNVKNDVMFTANYLKFTKSIYANKLRGELLSSGDDQLCEASPRDKYWGIGLSLEGAAQHKGGPWPGRNEMGKILMVLRQKLRDEKEKRRIDEAKDEAAQKRDDKTAKRAKVKAEEGGDTDSEAVNATKGAKGPGGAGGAKANANANANAKAKARKLKGRK